MRMPRWITLLGVAIALTVLAVPDEAQTFGNYHVGDKLPNASLQTLAGKKAPLLRKDRKVNVFFFFRPDQENSRTALRELAKCETELEGRPIYWTGVVSDSHARKDSRAEVKASGFVGPILVDENDTLYGKLGVKLHPVTGIANDKGSLIAYEPFHKLNYCVVIKARVQHLLGELNDAELEKAINPPKATQGGDHAVAGRNLKFAGMLLKAKKYDKAMQKVDEALAKEPQLAAAHAMAGAIHAAKDDCKAAAISFGQALALDPKDERALEGAKKCGSTPPAEGATPAKVKPAEKPSKKKPAKAKAKGKAKK